MGDMAGTHSSASLRHQLWDQVSPSSLALYRQNQRNRDEFCFVRRAGNRAFLGEVFLNFLGPNFEFAFPSGGSRV